MSDAGAVHMFVHGRVQGVFYRAKTQKVAEGLGLTGWVKNCRDGSVEIHAEGNKEKLEELIKWCRNGPAIYNHRRIKKCDSTRSASNFRL